MRIFIQGIWRFAVDRGGLGLEEGFGWPGQSVTVVGVASTISITLGIFGAAVPCHLACTAPEFVQIL